MSAALVTALASSRFAPACIRLPARPSGSPAPSTNRYARMRTFDGPEAGAWLRDRPGARVLAPRRFALGAEALGFVRRLREAGVARVLVPASRIRLRGFAEEADTLAFEVGPGTHGLALVAALCAEESCDWELPLADARFGWIRWR